MAAEIPVLPVAVGSGQTASQPAGAVRFRSVQRHEIAGNRRPAVIFAGKEASDRLKKSFPVASRPFRSAGRQHRSS